MLDAREVRRLDLNSQWHGVPTARLMQNAGRAVAKAALSHFSPRRVVVLCGPGNNGGDGAVAAAHLAQHGIHVDVVFARDPVALPPGDARGAVERLRGTTAAVHTYTTVAALRRMFEAADVLIDALLGVGVQGAPRAPISLLIREANRSGKPILSVDVPSGLGSRLQVRPAVTVALHAAKRGMNRSNSGRIEVADIGIPPAATDVGPGDLALRYRPNAPESHKGQNGRVLVVAGGPYCGAPILTAMAALRTGADLVRLYTPRSCAQAARTHSADLIVLDGIGDAELGPQDVDRLRPWMAKSDVVVVGPGMGRSAKAAAAIEAVLTEARRRKLGVVLDADALAVVGSKRLRLRGLVAVATPHHREFRDLTRRRLPKHDAAQRTAVARAARALGITILLKGPTDEISDGRQNRSNRIHHPWMTVGGTGDVLAGCTATLMARGMEPFDAACAAAFLNGAAGLRAFESQSWGARASDLIAEIPRVLRDWVR